MPRYIASRSSYGASKMIEVAAVLVGLPALVLGYAYVGYPLVLQVLSFAIRSRQRHPRPESPDEWPFVCVSLPAYNEEDTIRGAVEALLGADYPADRRQIVVISDASTDRTDEIVREYEEEGVELLRVEGRGGKTAAENAAIPYLRGDIVVNTDASVRVRPDALKALVRPFSDPKVGVASGRDRSVEAAGDTGADQNAGEAEYVGYEMRVRSLETGLGGIVGASGCFYAIRRELHEAPVPEHLSRDFCAALTARDHGYRSVSVSDAVCVVPRAGALACEFRRKVRTIARGMQTLAYKRHLLNPFRYGRFAWKLWSHKAARWLGAGLAPLAVLGLGVLSLESPLALAALAAVVLTGAAAAVAVRRSEQAEIPRLVQICGYLYAANAAAALALWKVIREERHAVWEPTRRR